MYLLSCGCQSLVWLRSKNSKSLRIVEGLVFPLETWLMMVSLSRRAKDPLICGLCERLLPIATTRRQDCRWIPLPRAPWEAGAGLSSAEKTNLSTNNSRISWDWHVCHAWTQIGTCFTGALGRGSHRQSYQRVVTVGSETILSQVSSGKTNPSPVYRRLWVLSFFDASFDERAAPQITAPLLAVVRI